ncbi:N-acetyltransferase [Actinacidiphila alni]|uniref:GNAT family N-acetyltransferase n=1 Tax=Actinacidiphila alni TaxID=380248 RepID=UPI0033C19614
MPSGTSADAKDPFRTPEEEDLQRLLELDHEAFAEEGGYPFFFLRQLFDAHRHDFILLERDGELYGYALAVVAAGEDVAWLLSLAVSAPHQGQGCGRALLDEAVEHVRRAGARQLNLVVRPDNTFALRLYRHAGFTGDGKILHEYYGKERDRILLSLPLTTAASNAPSSAPPMD